MKKISSLARLALVATTMVSAPVWAQMSAPGWSKFYLGAGVGAADASGNNGSGRTSGGVPYSISGGDRTKTSWKLYGGYQFTPMWGLEGQYTDLGRRNATVAFGAPVNSSGTTGDAKMSQWSLAATAMFPFAGNFYAMGKLGASRNRLDSSSATAGGATASTGSSDKTGVLAGLGIGYGFNKNVGVRLEYENFGKFSTSGNSGNGRADNIALSVRYSF